MSCDHPLRDGPCVLEESHKGRHTTVGFYCDGCGHMRRGQPHAQSEDIVFCFLCVVPWKRVRETYS